MNTRYYLKQAADGTWYVKDEWANKTLLRSPSKDMCNGYLKAMVEHF